MLTKSQATLQRDRDQEIRDITSSFAKVWLESGDLCTSQYLDTEDGGLERLGAELSRWEDVPRPLVSWLQAQNGLKINGKTITNREMLETAFRLLHYSDKSLLLYDLDRSSIVDIAVDVAFAYTREINLPRKEFIQNNTVPGEAGQVVRRTCSSCNGPALDDCFPIFCRKWPDHYVVKVIFRHGGCGRPECEGNPSLLPSDSQQRYKRPQARSFAEKRRDSGVSILYRSGKDLENCMTTVLVQCANGAPPGPVVNSSPPAICRSATEM